MPAEEKSANPSAAPELSPLMKIVQPLLGERILSHVNFRGDDRIHVAREKLLEVCMLLRDAPELAFDFLADVTAVDYLGQPDDFKMNLEVWDENRAVMKRIPQYRHRIVPPPHGPEPRFAVVYHLMSTRNAHRLRIKCRVPEDDPSIPSVVPVWIGADWLERETYDMYGIIFTGHPNLQRIYLYEEFKGHPLRKDYGKWDEQPIQPFLGPGANEPRRAVVRPDNGDSRPATIPKPDEPRR